MDEALIALLEKKDFEYISIKEICSAAGVNRSTFYLHYENTSDLLEECIELMHRRFNSYFDLNADSLFAQRLKSCSKEELMLITPEYLTPYLSFIRDHKKLYLTAIKNPSVFRLNDTYQRLFTHIFDPILSRFDVPQSQRVYMMAFYLNGIAAIVAEWLKADCAPSIEEISEIINKCIEDVKS